MNPLSCIESPLILLDDCSLHHPSSVFMHSNRGNPHLSTRYVFPLRGLSWPNTGPRMTERDEQAQGDARIVHARAALQCPAGERPAQDGRRKREGAHSRERRIHAEKIENVTSFDSNLKNTCAKRNGSKSFQILQPSLATE